VESISVLQAPMTLTAICSQIPHLKKIIIHTNAATLFLIYETKQLADRLC